MAKRDRCGRVWQEPPGEEGDHPCPCNSLVRNVDHYEEGEDWDETVAESMVEERDARPDVFSPRVVSELEKGDDDD